jgi:hypothetical protein
MLAAFMFGGFSFIFSKIGEHWWKYGASGVMGFLFLLTMMTFLSRQGRG